MDTSKIKRLYIHNTAVSYNKNPDQFAANNEYHRKQWNFKSSLGFYLGYNAEIAKDGTLRTARADGEETAAIVGHNTDGLHIALDLNGDMELPTPEQIYSLGKWLAEKCVKYNIPTSEIHYHREYANKTCPGKLIPDKWATKLADSFLVK